MLSYLPGLLSAFAAPILALPTTPSTIVGHWTLTHFHRGCLQGFNGGLCGYAFGLRENDDPKAAQDASSPDCGLFDGIFGEGASPCFVKIPNNTTDFADIPASQCGFAGTLSVQGGWNTTGGPSKAFLTVVVTDSAKNAYAFFSYKETDFDQDGFAPEITRPAYRIGTFGSDLADGVAPWANDNHEDKNDGAYEDKDEAKYGGDHYSKTVRLLERQGDDWQNGDLGKLQISQLRRWFDEDVKTMFTSFDINTTAGDAIRCELRITDSDPKGSWTSRGPCDKFTISWGYNDAEDSAVMTVCNSRAGQIAWVGFNGVSDLQKTFGPSHWEPIRIVPCQ